MPPKQRCKHKTIIHTCCKCGPKRTSIAVNYCRFGPNARTPTLGTPSSAGHYLYSSEDVTISPNSGYTKINTHLGVEIPPGYFGLVAGVRSGPTISRNLNVFTGIIDSDFRNGICVLVENKNKQNSEPIFLPKGTRIAQLLLLSTPKVVFTEVSSPTNIYQSQHHQREDFGSTSE